MKAEREEEIRVATKGLKNILNELDCLYVKTNSVCRRENLLIDIDKISDDVESAIVLLER